MVESTSEEKSKEIANEIGEIIKKWDQALTES
jgi:hypothetical protein